MVPPPPFPVGLLSSSSLVPVPVLLSLFHLPYRPLMVMEDCPRARASLLARIGETGAYKDKAKDKAKDEDEYKDKDEDEDGTGSLLTVADMRSFRENHEE